MERSTEKRNPGDTDELHCDLCNIQCASKTAYVNHLRGMLHTQKTMQEENYAAGEIVEEPAPIPVDRIKERARQAREFQQQQEKRAAVANEKSDKVEGSYHCEICDVSCTGFASYDQHINGVKHLKKMKNIERGVPIVQGKNVKKLMTTEKSQANFQVNSPPQLQAMIEMCQEPLIGLQYITEYQKEYQMGEPRYVCYLCESKCDPRTILKHVMGIKHRLQYMKEHYMPYHMLIKQLPGKKSEQSSKVAEYARVIEEEEGRKPIKVRVELDECAVAVNQSVKRKNEEPDFGGWKRLQSNDLNTGGYRDGSKSQGGISGFSESSQAGYRGGPRSEHEGFDSRSQGQDMGGHSNNYSDSRQGDLSRNLTSDYPSRGYHESSRDLAKDSTQRNRDPTRGSYDAYSARQNRDPVSGSYDAYSAQQNRDLARGSYDPHSTWRNRDLSPSRYDAYSRQLNRDLARGGYDAQSTQQNRDLSPSRCDPYSTQQNRDLAWGGYDAQSTQQNRDLSRGSYDTQSTQQNRELAPGSYDPHPTQQNRATYDQYSSSNNSQNSSSNNAPGRRDEHSNTDFMSNLQSLIDTPVTIKDEEEASLALKVSNILTQALFEFRLKGVPLELLGGLSKKGTAESSTQGNH